MKNAELSLSETGVPPIHNDGGLSRNRYHRTSTILVLAIVGSSLCGCQRNHYEVHLNPVGLQLERKLTCWRGGAPQEDGSPCVSAFSPAELRHIADTYESPLPKDLAQRHTFLRTLAGEMPSDIGGHGSYIIWTTPLGSASVYLERFRGVDDLAANLQARQQTAEQVARWITGWLMDELGGEPGADQLQAFLETSFPRDLWNLSLYAWAQDIAGTHGAKLDECLMRVAQYLAERAYFTRAEIPEWHRAINNYDIEPTRLMVLIQRLVATKMGIDAREPIPASLKFLADKSTAEASALKYLANVEDFQALLQDIHASSSPSQGTGSLVDKPLNIRLAMVLYPLGEIITPADRLAVTLRVADRPCWTNGIWEADAGEIRWSQSILARESPLSEYPAFAYAVWSTPNEVQQVQTFGRRILKGSELAEYCLGYQSLSPHESQAWDQMLSLLPTASDPVAHMRQFRFAFETKEAADSHHLGSRLRDLMAGAMDNRE